MWLSDNSLRSSQGITSARQLSNNAAARARAIRVLPSEASGCPQLWDAHKRQERSLRIYASRQIRDTSLHRRKIVYDDLSEHEAIIESPPTPHQLPPDVRVSVSPKSPRKCTVHAEEALSSRCSAHPTRPINHISSLRHHPPSIAALLR
jgi:hypothetical protein